MISFLFEKRVTPMALLNSYISSFHHHSVPPTNVIPILLSTPLNWSHIAPSTTTYFPDTLHYCHHFWRRLHHCRYFHSCCRHLHRHYHSNHHQCHIKPSTINVSLPPSSPTLHISHICHLSYTISLLLDTVHYHQWPTSSTTTVAGPHPLLPLLTLFTTTIGT